MQCVKLCNDVSLCNLLNAYTRIMRAVEMDREVFVPVRCDEKETDYSGKWYWEPIKTIVEVNGEKIHSSDRARSTFHPGDRVVIKYRSREYRGCVIDPEKEVEAVDQVETDDKSTDSGVGSKRSRSSTTSVQKRRKVFKKPGTYI